MLLGQTTRKMAGNIHYRQLEQTKHKTREKLCVVSHKIHSEKEGCTPGKWKKANRE